MKWNVTVTEYGQNKTVKVTANSKQEAIKKATEKTGIHRLVDCRMIRA